MRTSRKVRSTLPCSDGVNRVLESVCVSTPIGDMVIHLCSEGIHMIYQKEEITDENFAPDRSHLVSLLGSPPLDSKAKICADNCVNWLKTYFHNTARVSELKTPSLCPVTSKSTSFRDRVWMTLANSVAFGETVTYGELASMAGSCGAQQAVGTAMAANPFQLIVPCHRVVKAGKKIGKYSSGCRNTVKVWLLEHEGLRILEDGSLSHG